MMRTEKLNAIKGAIKDGKTVQAAGGIAVTMQQSDKLRQAGLRLEGLQRQRRGRAQGVYRTDCPCRHKRRQSHRLHRWYAAHQ